MRLVTMVLGILLAAFGVMLLFLPGLTALGVTLLLAVLLLLAGANGVASFLLHRQRSTISDLLSGGVTLLFGTLLLADTLLTLWEPLTMLYIFGVWGAVTGLLQVLTALRERRLHRKRWWLLLLSAWLCAFGGAYCFLHPTLMPGNIGEAMGVLLLLQGIHLFLVGVRTSPYPR